MNWPESVATTAGFLCMAIVAMVLWGGDKKNKNEDKSDDTHAQD